MTWNIDTYLRAARSADTNTRCGLGVLLRSYWRWSSLLGGDGGILIERETPWITFSAIDYLHRKIQKDWRVFEFGCGASTLFWARRAMSIVSVEHDRDWYQKMQKEILNRCLSNVDLRLVEPEPDPIFEECSSSNPTDCISGNPYYDGSRFEAYVGSIVAFPDASFSLIVVDGRARPSCLTTAADKVRPGGFLLLDNSERPRYMPAQLMLSPSRFTRLDFPGPSPLVDFFTRTTLWRRSM